ncbi:hypothetical protein [Burkholderia seminalis]|uniref:hypothetical protein n=1 Tax=Burkholderia seminalis TaxID=488731 RepID=UPI0019038593|nr:hypothetical protein [Burkholderia seminalis]MBJ9969129.1 hypothetical protein [Burkholderia seminalis]MDN7592132.1 hypothetical protein [Burkholderia seminalis]
MEVMAMNRWMTGRDGPVPTSAGVRLLRGQQSVQCFAAREKHRFLITKARLLRNLQWCGRAGLPRRRGVEFDAIARRAASWAAVRQHGRFGRFITSRNIDVIRAAERLPRVRICAHPAPGGRTHETSRCRRSRRDTAA